MCSAIRHLQVMDSQAILTEFNIVNKIIIVRYLMLTQESDPYHRILSCTIWAYDTRTLL